jgi:hypothetical protein
MPIKRFSGIDANHVVFIRIVGAIAEDACSYAQNGYLRW